MKQIFCFGFAHKICDQDKILLHINLCIIRFTSSLNIFRHEIAYRKCRSDRDNFVTESRPRLVGVGKQRERRQNTWSRPHK